MEIEASAVVGSASSPRVTIAGVGSVAGQALEGLSKTLRANGVEQCSVRRLRALEDLKDDPAWSVAIVLSPHKQAALEICSDLGERAARARVVDTLVRARSDVVGLNANSYAVQDACMRLSATAPRSALVVGTGASARSASVALATLWPTVDLRIAGRNHTEAQKIAVDLGLSRAYEPDEIARGDIVVHATTVGEIDDHDELALPLALDTHTAFLDLNVRGSALQVRALAAGCLTLGGRYVQAINNVLRAALINSLVFSNAL